MMPPQKRPVHASHKPLLLQTLLPQHGMVELQVCPLLRHWHCPLIQPRPEQHWLDAVQLFPCGWHASHWPASQNRSEQQGASAPHVLPSLTQPHSPE